MGSTSGGLVKNNEGQAVPQGYSSTDDAYKPVAVRQIGSSEYGQETVNYVVTSSSALVAQSGDTGGRPKTLGGGEQNTQTVTISTSTDGLSGIVDLGPYRVSAIYMSTAWTTAGITFAAAASSGGTYMDVYDDQGSEVTVISPSASRMIALDVVAGSLAQLRWVKFRSGTSTGPVTQAAARTLTLVQKS